MNFNVLKWPLLAALIAMPGVAQSFDDAKHDNWHQWRGPEMTGVATKGNPPTEWDESKNIKWKVEIPGDGSSTPIIWGDKLFVTTAIETDRTKSAQGEPSREYGQRGGGPGAPENYYKFDVICYDKNTGEVIWQKTAVEAVPHEAHHSTNTYAAGSPYTDGEHLWVTFGSRGFFCFDLDGNPVWERDLGDMTTRNSFGEGSSLTVHGDSVIIQWDEEGQSYLYSLDAKTGETRWRTPRDERSNWSTPLVTEYEDVTQVIVNGHTAAISYNFENGEEIWRCAGQTMNVIPCPIRHEDIVILMSGFRGEALYAVPLSAEGDVTGTDKIAWSYSENTPYVPSPLLYGDLLYYMKSNNPILTILHAENGEEAMGQSRLPDFMGTVYASPVGAGGHVYFTTRDGNTLVIKHGESIEAVAVNELEDEIDASIAISGDALYLRGKDYLYCIAE